MGPVPIEFYLGKSVSITLKSRGVLESVIGMLSRQDMGGSIASQPSGTLMVGDVPIAYNDITTITLLTED